MFTMIHGKEQKVRCNACNGPLHRRRVTLHDDGTIVLSAVGKGTLACQGDPEQYRETVERFAFVATPKPKAKAKPKAPKVVSEVQVVDEVQATKDALKPGAWFYYESHGRLRYHGLMLDGKRKDRLAKRLEVTNLNRV